MQLKPEEISKVIRSQIKYYDNAIQQNETGTILMVGDGIARASGLINCMAGELLEFEDGSFGMAQNLEENSVSIVLFGSDEKIGEGQTVKRTGKVVSVPVGDATDWTCRQRTGTAHRRRRPHRDGRVPCRLRARLPVSVRRQGRIMNPCRPVLRPLTPWFPSAAASVS